LYPLGTHWVALVHEDGSVLLQYHKQVLSKSGHVLDLIEGEHPEISDRGAMDLQVRTLGLSVDGSVMADSHGISSGGVLSNQSYAILENAHSSLGKAMQASSKKADGRR